MTDTASDAFKETIADPAKKAAESIRDAGTKIAENSTAGFGLASCVIRPRRKADAAVRGGRAVLGVGFGSFGG